MTKGTMLTLIVLDSFILPKTFSYIITIRDISNSHDLKNFLWTCCYSYPLPESTQKRQTRGRENLKHNVC